MKWYTYKRDNIPRLQWYVWFAWYPVVVFKRCDLFKITKKWAWLCKVDRKFHNDAGYEWEYKEIDKND